MFRIKSESGVNSDEVFELTVSRNPYVDNLFERLGISEPRNTWSDSVFDTFPFGNQS